MQEKKGASIKQPASSVHVYIFRHEDYGVSKAARITWRKYFDYSPSYSDNPKKNIFDYFVFNIVDSGVNCGLPRSGARRRALAQFISNARGLDINSLRSTKNHPQDPRFCRHQQHGDPNNARGLDNNIASDRDCDSMTTTRLRHRPLRRADHAAPDKS
jgi:hypothetical protein